LKLEKVEKVVPNVRVLVHDVKEIPQRRLILVTSDGKQFGVYDPDLVRLQNVAVQRLGITGAGSIALEFKRDNTCQVGIEEITAKGRETRAIQVVSCEEVHP
jgi:hypothetical protein